MAASSRSLYIVGFGVSILTASVLSLFASQKPDGLERVAQDLQFEHHATTLITFPGSEWLADYELKAVPQPLATPIAGALGTFAVFGITVGLGKLLKKPASPTK